MPRLPCGSAIGHIRPLGPIRPIDHRRKTTDHRPQTKNMSKEQTIDDQEDEQWFEAVMPRRRRRDEAEMDITPMIDITFLLLIFFLVASKMDAQADVRLPVAKYADAVSMQTAVVITVAAGTGDQSFIYKGNGTSDDTLLSSSSPADQEMELAAYVQQRLDSDSPPDSVVIKAAKGTKHREVARVAQAVGAVGDVHAKGIQLHVAVLEEQ